MRLYKQHAVLACRRKEVPIIAAAFMPINKVSNIWENTLSEKIVSIIAKICYFLRSFVPISYC